MDNVEFAGEYSNTDRKMIEDNLGTIASTPYGSAPYARDVGVHRIALPTQYAKNEYASELIAQAEEWEDRAEVTQVDVDNNGKVKVVIADVGN